MLSAEHMALQSRLVQQLAAIKQKELDYLLSRYQAIGVQSALVAACALQTLVSLDPSAPDVNRWVTYLFFISSMLCCLACTYVTVCVLYIGNWAPGLALRGPTGSLNRALDAVMAERGQVNFWFTFALLTFVIQTIVTVWVLNDTVTVTAWSIVCSIIGLGSIVYTGYYLKKMRERFFRDDSAYEQASRSVKLDNAPSVKETSSSNLTIDPGPARSASGIKSTNVPGRRRSTAAGASAAASGIRNRAQSKAGTGSPGTSERRVTIGGANEQPNKPLLNKKGESAHDASAMPRRSSMAGSKDPSAHRGSVSGGGGGGQGGGTKAGVTALRAIAKLQARARGNKTRDSPIAQELSRRLSERRSSVDAATIREAAAKSGAASSSSSSSSKPASAVPRMKQRRGSGTPVLDNPVSLVFNNPDVALGASGLGGNFAKGNAVPGAALETGLSFKSGSGLDLEMSGYMFKRVGMDTGARRGLFGGLKRASAIATVNLAITPSWQQRFFVLSEGTLQYWHTEEDCENQKAPSATIVLTGYECLVDPHDPNWGFELRPTMDTKLRTWYFRAFTEDDRLEWAKRLVAATYVNSTRSRKHSWW